MSKPNIYLSENELIQIYASIAYCLASTRKYGSCAVTEYLEISNDSYNNKVTIDDLQFKIYSEIKNEKKVDKIDETMESFEG